MQRGGCPRRRFYVCVFLRTEFNHLVDPFLHIRGKPYQQDRFDSHKQVGLLRSEEQTRAGSHTDQLHERPRHRLPIIRNKNPSIQRCERGHSEIAKSSGNRWETGDVFRYPTLIPPNRPRRSILLMTVQPRISTIHCKILYFLANPRYHSLCSPRPLPPRRIIPRASARSIPFGVILSVAKDPLFVFLLPAPSASLRFVLILRLSSLHFR